MTTRPAVTLAALGLCAALWIGCGESEPDTASAEVLPALRVATLAGDEVELQTLVGDKPLLLWFWAPW